MVVLFCCAKEMPFWKRYVPEVTPRWALVYKTPRASFSRGLYTFIFPAIKPPSRGYRLNKTISYILYILVKKHVVPYHQRFSSEKKNTTSQIFLGQAKSRHGNTTQFKNFAKLYQQNNLTWAVFLICICVFARDQIHSIPRGRYI